MTAGLPIHFISQTRHNFCLRGGMIFFSRPRAQGRRAKKKILKVVSGLGLGLTLATKGGKGLFSGDVFWRRRGLALAVTSRGRKSRDQLAIVGALGIETGARPPPPPDLTEAEKAIWNEQVNAVSDDYFPPETHPVLAQYCRHICRARWIAKQITEMQDDLARFDERKYQALLGLEKTQTWAIRSLANVMQLTQKSVNGNSSRRRANLPKPVWQKSQAA